MKKIILIGLIIIVIVLSLSTVAQAQKISDMIFFLSKHEFFSFVLMLLGIIGAIVCFSMFLKSWDRKLFPLLIMFIVVIISGIYYLHGDLQNANRMEALGYILFGVTGTLFALERKNKIFAILIIISSLYLIPYFIYAYPPYWYQYQMGMVISTFIIILSVSLFLNNIFGYLAFLFFITGRFLNSLFARSFLRLTGVPEPLIYGLTFLPALILFIISIYFHFKKR